MTTDQDSPILIVVDDSEDDFHLIKHRVLQTWPQAAVIHAMNRQMLQEDLETLAPDLVICDYCMPEITHGEVMALVKEIRPDTPLILLSGFASETLGLLAMQTGASDYVEKSKSDRLIPAIQRELQTGKLKKEKSRLEQAHRKAVFFDFESGLLNQQGLEKTFAGLQAALPHRQDLCLLTLRMRKNLSKDAFGNHTMRKNIVEKVLSRCQVLFKNDILSRWNDNLLAIVLEGFDWNNAREADIERLNQIEFELCKPFLVDTVAIRPNLRLGLARPNLDGTGLLALVTHARSVCAVLEQSGQGLYAALKSNVHEQATRRKLIERGLARGIRQNELVLDFQPVEDLSTARVVGVEALVRWTHPLLGRIMPAEFIGVAEDSGLVEALGYWVIENAARHLQQLHQAGHMLWCAINCSPKQLMGPHFSTEVCRRIRAAGLEVSWFEFEITESAAIQDMAQTVNALNVLKGEGAGIAMDDFGTGYASLNYLRALPVDVLKIDKSFVMGLLDDNNSQMIVKAVIDLAHALGLTVHAEGIETQAQRQALIEMGCDRLQGYWFAKPLDAVKLLEWLT